MDESDRAWKEEFNKRFANDAQKELGNFKTFNVMVTGRTGVGKSTLINAIFSEKLAKTGIGEPVTQNITRHKKEGFPVVLYDTPGIELTGKNGIDNLKEQIISEINKTKQSCNINEHIHCILYCISTLSDRVEPAEYDFLEGILKETKKHNIPVFIVLTKSLYKDDAEALKCSIKAHKVADQFADIICVLAEPKGEHEAYGLKELCRSLIKHLSEEISKTFIATQKTLDLKIEEARKFVDITAATTGAVGAAPIPFSDSFVLAPAQYTMLCKIAGIFGHSLKRKDYLSLTSVAMGPVLTSLLGRSFVRAILKILPGGNVAAGTVSGAAAALLTKALGEATIFVFSQIASGNVTIKDLTSSEGRKKFGEVFQEYWKPLFNDIWKKFYPVISDVLNDLLSGRIQAKDIPNEILKRFFGENRGTFGANEEV